MAVADTPTGYVPAVGVLCSFPQDILAELANDVLDFLSYSLGAVDTNTYRKRLRAAGVDVTPTQVQGATNALVYSLRDAVVNKLEPAALVSKLKGYGASVWSGKSVNVVKHVWGERGAQVVKAASSLPESLMNIGRLVSFKWALKLSVDSDSAKNLGRAFIAVELRIVDGADCMHTKSFELSLFQFQNWAKQLREINNVINDEI
eukprot:m.183799 g.183799  ORF g.183799 m.183799 type:complete len:204 (+) comp15942_c0_seq1:149-760(+)